MAEPTRRGPTAKLNAPDAYIVDTLMVSYKEEKDIAAALATNGYGTYTDRVRAIRLVKADRTLPKYKRLGMKRIAWFFGVTGRTLSNWWAAYRDGGLDALRDPVRPGREPKAPRKEVFGAIHRVIKEGEWWKKEDAKKKDDSGRGGGGGSDPCPACAAAAAGTDGEKGPAHRYRCKCKRRDRSGRRGKCDTERKKAGSCKCDPKKPCPCTCCRPTRPPPLGPDHAPGCPALDTAPPRTATLNNIREAIVRVTGVKYGWRHVLRLAKMAGLSKKHPTLYHMNRKERRLVLRWQRRAEKRLRRYRARGYTVIVMDEAYLVYSNIGGKKYYSLVGERIRLPYTGQHCRVTLYGALAEDGRQLFFQSIRSDSYSFIEFLKKARQRFGKVVVITDRYSAHTSRATRKFLYANRKANPAEDIRIVLLPPGCPFLNAVEECWNLLKGAILASRHYADFKDLRRAAFKYLRAARFGLDITKYLYGKVPPDLVIA